MGFRRSCPILPDVLRAGGLDCDLLSFNAFNTPELVVVYNTDEVNKSTEVILASA